MSTAAGPLADAHRSTGRGPRVTVVASTEAVEDVAAPLRRCFTHELSRRSSRQGCSGCPSWRSGPRAHLQSFCCTHHGLAQQVLSVFVQSYGIALAMLFQALLAIYHPPDRVQDFVHELPAVRTDVRSGADSLTGRRDAAK